MGELLISHMTLWSVSELQKRASAQFGMQNGIRLGESKRVYLNFMAGIKGSGHIIKQIEREPPRVNLVAAAVTAGINFGRPAGQSIMIAAKLELNRKSLKSALGNRN